MQNRCCCAKVNHTKLITLLYAVRLLALGASPSKGASAGSYLCKKAWVGAARHSLLRLQRLGL